MRTIYYTHKIILKEKKLNHNKKKIKKNPNFSIDDKHISI